MLCAVCQTDMQILGELFVNARSPLRPTKMVKTNATPLGCLLFNNDNNNNHMGPNKDIDKVSGLPTDDRVCTPLANKVYLSAKFIIMSSQESLLQFIIARPRLLAGA